MKFEEERKKYEEMLKRKKALIKFPATLLSSICRKSRKSAPTYRVQCFLTQKIGGFQLLFSQRFIENNLFEVPELLSHLYEVRRG